MADWTVTPDGFALVACHEIGHHLGGAPKISRAKWASNEGESDYFANLKCLRKLFADDDNVRIVEGMNIPSVVKQKCLDQFSDANQAAICMREAMAGQSVSYLFKALMKQSTTPKFDTPDPTVVTQTNDAHPDTQCRMDTYFQGSLCTMGADQQLSDTDPNIGTCSRKFGQTVGTRPLCWFKPQMNLRLASH